MSTSHLKVCYSDIAGYYDFIEQEVHFNNISIEDVKLAQSEAHKGMNPLSLDGYNAITKVIPLMYHELTHWIDHSSTLWGLNLTKRTIETNLIIDKVEQRGKEIIDFFSFIRNFNYPKYYTYMYPDHTDDSPWQYQYTMGRIYNRDGSMSDRPIIFTRFSDPYDIPVVRVPFSITSVLEVSAMYQEINAKMAFLSHLAENDKIIENKVIQKQMINFLYNKNVAEYSVAAHSVANRLGLSDIYSAFRISSIIARITLNFPTKQFKKISFDYDRYSEWGEGVDKIFTNIGQRGSLFFLIADNLPEQVKNLKKDSEIKNEIFKLLQSWGCDNEEKFTTDLDSEVFDLLSEIEKLEPEYCRKIKDIFFENYSICPKWGSKYNFIKIHNPIMYLSDATEYSGEKKSKGVDLLKKLDLIKLMSKIHNFNEGCL